MLLAKEGVELCGMLVGVGKHCGIEMKVEGGTSNENFDTAIGWRKWNISAIRVVWQQMLQEVHVELSP